MGRIFEHIDWVSGIVILCLASFGLFLLLTINQTLFFQQLFYLVLAGVLLIFASHLDSTILWWFAPVGYVGSILFLLLSYLGPSIRGAQRWMMIGSVQLQPSELVKPFLILAFARFMTQYSPRNLRFIFIHVVLFLIPFFLVFKQPDLGSSLVYGGFWVSMLLGAGFSMGMFVGAVSLGGIFLPFVWHLLAQYQRVRISTFLNPGLDPAGAGYNALQSMIAVGSGQLFGRGLGRGTQSHLRFLPEFHTDFIFATLVEELGFVGGILLFFGYGLLLWRIIVPLLRGVVTDVFPFVYSVGLFAMLLTQIAINAGMNMGLIPITGITLPFISSGGSSLLSLAISFGFLWALQRSSDARSAIAIH